MVMAAAGGTAVAAVPASSASTFNPFVLKGGSAIQKSNWAGYIALGSAGKFTTATANWTIPAATCLSDSDLYAPWVGIDGDGDTTVEQTGAATSCSSGSPKFKAWYEMYPAAPHYYSNPISVGDAFTATVTATGTSFKLSISDTTKGWTETVTKTLTSAKKASAEAVVEAPGGFPKIAGVNFTGVKFDGKDLNTFKLSKSESNGTGGTYYAPGPITNGDDFSIKPVS
jgi:hypothetical protein